MRFSCFAVLSGLAALVVVNALPADNLQRRVPSEDMIICPEIACPMIACRYPTRPTECGFLGWNEIQTLGLLDGPGSECQICFSTTPHAAPKGSFRGRATSESQVEFTDPADIQVEPGGKTDAEQNGSVALESADTQANGEAVRTHQDVQDVGESAKARRDASIEGESGSASVGRHQEKRSHDIMLY
ncbi:hypothetical protein OG21DRAFT_1521738 [Imleria badia]|nr:hypothetical protein OG21DRAFT_1521738 [Imleria badia]